MIDFVEAVKRPLRTDPVTVLLGVVFSIFVPLHPLLHGLGVETSRRTHQRSPTMPHFDDFVDSFFTGLMVFVIGILYSVPALLILVVGAAVSLPLVFSLVQQIVTSPFVSLPTLAGILVGGTLVGTAAIVLGLIAAILLPVGIQRFAVTKRIGSAFELSPILDIVVRPDYWIAWIVMAAYGVVLLGVWALLSTPVLSIVSILLSGVVAYMWWMTVYVVMAEVVSEADHPKHAEKAGAFKRPFKKKSRSR